MPVSKKKLMKSILISWGLVDFNKINVLNINFTEKILLKYDLIFFNVFLVILSYFAGSHFYKF